MKMIKKYIDDVCDEVCSAMEYAEKYYEYKSSAPNIAKLYYEMSEQEMTHAEYLTSIGQQKITALPWVPEEDKDAWDDCLRKSAEKMAIVKMMLSK